MFILNTIIWSSATDHQLGAASLWNIWCTQMQQTLRCHSLIRRLNFLIYLHYITLSFTFKYWVLHSSFNRWQSTVHRLNMITLGKWRSQDICTQPSTYAWEKQEMDSDCLCNKGKSSGCFTVTEVTIKRDDKTCQHSTAKLVGNICTTAVL